MAQPSFEEFRAVARRRGFDEVIERSWKPGEVVAPHGHPFVAEALVVQGEMWLTIGSDTRRLLPGDTFELAFDQPHAERYGPDGATYWVARRNAPVPA